MDTANVSHPECPPAGQWAMVTTDHASAKSGFARLVPRQHTHVGFVTYASEDGVGFEMTTGERGSFTLREILVNRVSSIKVLPGSYSPGLHQVGITEAETRQRDADRKKVTREKREGLFR
jgi:hypothetical protein